MKTPDISREQSSNHAPSPLSHTIQKVWDLLDDPTQSVSINRFRELWNRISQRIEETLDPNYDFRDFRYRICQSFEKKRATLESLLGSNPDLVNAWQEMQQLQGIPSRDILLNRFVPYLENAICASMDAHDLEQTKMFTLDEHNFLDFLRSEKHLSLRYLIIDLDVLANFDRIYLDALTHQLGNYAHINMDCNRIGMIEPEVTKKIFSGLSSARSLNLTTNLLYSLTQEGWFTLGDGLEKIQCLDLSLNQLWHAPLQGIEHLFSRLSGLKALSLENNALRKMNPQMLDVIFSPLTHLRHLDVQHNHLAKIFGIKLQTISRNLPELVSLDLCNNQIHEMQNEQIRDFFTPLTHLKQITLQEEISKNDMLDFKKRLQDLVPSLKASICILNTH